MDISVFIRCFRNFSILVAALLGLYYASPYILSVSEIALGGLGDLLRENDFAFTIYAVVTVITLGFLCSVLCYESKALCNSEIKPLSNSFLRKTFATLTVVFTIMLLINNEITQFYQSILYSRIDGAFSLKYVFLMGISFSGFFLSVVQLGFFPSGEEH